ncbi:MAG: hypothetical protein FWE67_13765, partial [Planctomycetaceae bacterium]|nr:hypothetical protein [Planctomycetaceae bacterium]
MLRFCLASLVLCFAVLSASAENVRWNNSLSFSGGGIWTIRIPLAIENGTTAPIEGKPIKVQLPETVKPPVVREIRITKEDGQEVIFSVFNAKNERVFDGELAKDSYLMIPADCDPGKKTVYFLYYGNEKAEVVPDYLEAGGAFSNGDFEEGGGALPLHWVSDRNDAAHQNLWVNENPKSGKKCMKTVIKDGEAPSWFAVRQTIFYPIVPGGKYKFSGWVRSENVKGRTGWFVHIGNSTRGDIVNRVLTPEPPSAEWKEITIELTAPENADRATVGTVLYGTGTAWFDNVSFERIDKEKTLQFAVGEPEIIPYKVYEAEKEFAVLDENDYLCRSTFRIINDSDKPLENAVVLMTLRGALAHGLRGTMKDVTLVMGSGAEQKNIPVNILDAANHRLSARISVPAKAVQYL